MLLERQLRLTLWLCGNRTGVQTDSSLLGTLSTVPVSLWDSKLSLSTLTTGFDSNLPSEPLTYLKIIGKSPHNLFRRPGGWAACNFLDSHHAFPQSTEGLWTGQLLVFRRLWIGLSGLMVFRQPQFPEGCLEGLVLTGWRRIQKADFFFFVPHPLPKRSQCVHRGPVHLKMEKKKSLKPLTDWLPFSFLPHTTHK